MRLVVASLIVVTLSRRRLLALWDHEGELLHVILENLLLPIGIHLVGCCVLGVLWDVVASFCSLGMCPEMSQFVENDTILEFDCALDRLVEDLFWSLARSCSLGTELVRRLVVVPVPLLLQELVVLVEVLRSKMKRPLLSDSSRRHDHASDVCQSQR